MIFTERQITVRNGKSTINEPVILYRGDYEVSIKFTIMESKFRFKSGVNLVNSDNASHGQLAILAPYGGNVFSEIVKCEDGTVTFTLTKEMIDQLEEVGLYSFQIRLFDYYRESRVSIPPVVFGIEVREPVASEDHDNEVNIAIVGYSIAKVVDPSKENVGDTFDPNGNYNKTDWETGDRISEGKLNKIEDALDKINQNDKVLGKRVTSNFNVLDANKADKNEVNSKVWGMANMGQDVKEAMTGGSVAVVGKDTVLTENIVDGQVTYSKTNFMERDKTINLFDGNYKNIQLYGSDTLQIRKNISSSLCAIIEIEPNTQYSIIKNKASRFNYGTATRLMEDLELLDGAVVKGMGNSNNLYSVFTSGPNDKYLYVNVTMDNEDIFMQIIKGCQTKLTTDKYLVKFTEDVNVYTKQDVEYLLDNIEIQPSAIPLMRLNVENIAKDKIIFNHTKIAGDSSLYFINVVDDESAVSMVNIQPNTQYSIILEGTDLLDNDKPFFKMFTSSEEYSPGSDNWNSGHNLYHKVNNSLTFNFVSGENDRYLYLYYTNEDMYHDFVVCEGIHYETYYIPNDRLSVYSKDEIDSMVIPKERVDFVKKNHSLNLWDGILYKNRRIGGNVPDISIQNSDSSDLYIVKLKPNTEYSVLVKDTNLIYQDRKYIKAFISDVFYDEYYKGKITYIDYYQPYVNLNCVFTTGNDKEEYYLYMYLFDHGIENPVFQVVEGHTTVMSIDSMDDIYVFDGVSVYAKHEVYNKDEVDSMVSGTPKGNKFVKQGEKCNITMNNKVGYVLEHKTSSDINLDTWMLTSGTVNDITIWSGSDIEAPIKEKGAVDFIGGVHGDEKFESVTILCDGNIINMSEDYNTSFSNLTVFVKSTLYRCDTSTPVFTRYKKLEFTNTELIVSNKLVCLVDDFLVERHTGCGLYSMYKDIMTGYTVNTIPELITSGSVSKNDKIDIGSFYGDGYVITLKVLSGKTDKYRGSVTDFADESKPRFKFYFDCISYSDDGYPLTLNGELITSFSIDIK